MPYRKTLGQRTEFIYYETPGGSKEALARSLRSCW